MSQISLKSISGITSITTPAGVDNQLFLFIQMIQLRISGIIQSGNQNITGVVTATNFKVTGSSNLHRWS